MRTEVIESLSLAIAQLVERERELNVQLDQVRAQKAERVARIAAIASGRDETPGPQGVIGSKRDRVRQYLRAAVPGSVVSTQEIAAVLNIESNVVSAYLTQFRDQRLVEHVSRGHFRVADNQPKENAPPVPDEASSSVVPP